MKRFASSHFIFLLLPVLLSALNVADFLKDHTAFAVKQWTEEDNKKVLLSNFDEVRDMSLMQYKRNKDGKMFLGYVLKQKLFGVLKGKYFYFDLENDGELGLKTTMFYIPDYLVEPYHVKRDGGRFREIAELKYESYKGKEGPYAGLLLPAKQGAGYMEIYQKYFENRTFADRRLVYLLWQYDVFTMRKEYALAVMMMDRLFPHLTEEGNEMNLWLLNKGESLLQQAKYEDALVLFKRLHERDRDFVPAAGHIYNCSRRLGKKDATMEKARSVLLANQDHWFAKMIVLER